jgi:hypothetical protein
MGMHELKDELRLSVSKCCICMQHTSKLEDIFHCLRPHTTTFRKLLISSSSAAASKYNSMCSTTKETDLLLTNDVLHCSIVKKFCGKIV